jgi:glycosyltransferase involved in cell wall biosynthesis
MSEFPKISIVTVNYNKGNFIEDTIQSVISQAYPNLEYIIIDGASTDNSISIIKKYEDKLSYFISEPDKGMTDALMKGFAKATGEIFAWINSDDTYLPGAFMYVAKQYKATKFELLYGDCLIADVENKLIKRARSLKTNYKAQAEGSVTIFQPSSFWSAALYKKVGGVSHEFQVTMDGNLFYKMLKNSKNTIQVNKAFSRFRIHENQSGSWAPEGRYSMEREWISSYNDYLHPFIRFYYKKLFKPKVLFLRFLGF